jgi:DNA topoisomerase-3
MKENGIGRPSTRANIIETLFKRQYIKRNKKQLLPTVTGVALIDVIQNELLKSAELTGRWEKQLKDIEKGEYSAALFINNMKKMVDALVYEVRSESTGANISHASVLEQRQTTPKVKKKEGITAISCPKCKMGTLLKGNSAYGCSAFKEGCKFVLPFENFGKKISEKQFVRLLNKGSTVNLKGFSSEAGTTEGLLRFDEQFKIVLEPKKNMAKPAEAPNASIPKPVSTQAMPKCPKCKLGNIIKGKTAYGCSAYKTGCDFKMTFEAIRAQAKDQKLTKDLVYSILKNSL